MAAHCLTFVALLTIVWLPLSGGLTSSHRYCSSTPEMYFANVAGKITGGVDIVKTEDQTLCSERAYVDQRYREVDGRCNHRKDYGSTMKPVKRYLRPHYQDKKGLNTPRIYSVKDNTYLPSPREVSWKIHPDNKYTDNHTMLVMQLGQLLDHDITSSPVPTEHNSSIKCCNIPHKNVPPQCFPIPIPRDDPTFAPETCMEFVRSEPAVDENGSTIYPREQINSITSFVDGSCFYGSDSDTHGHLRHQNGRGCLLKTVTVDGKERLPVDKDSECLKTSDSYCQLAGDNRVNEHPYLASLHTVFHLYHNQIVRALAKGALQKNHQHSDPQSVENFIYWAPLDRQEHLYQEARKIVGAVWQKIVYCEWLPIILGPHLIDHYRLGCERRSKYNPYVDPRIANVFLAAAFRFGHSMIPNNVKINNRMVPLRTQFMIPDNALKYYDSNLEGMTEQNSQEVVDRFVSASVTKHLFEPDRGQKGVLDLVALNIQRGRDHGIPSYYYWRRYYGLKRVTSFRDMGEKMGAEMAKLYKSILDVDLFPAGLMEEPLPRAMVGPTFGNIIAQQFADLKFGDAHFFLSKEIPQGFTPAQVDAIRSVNMGDVMCQNSEMQFLQVNPFLEPSVSNPKVRCSSRREIDIRPWMIYF